MIEQQKLHEFEEKIYEVVKGDSYEKPSVKVTVPYGTQGDCLDIEIAQMYEYVKMGFPTLQTISDILGTEKIDIYSQDSRGGCDTCDYGSKL
jgi:hypothetical protein